jgi:hypothetical protein
VGPDLDDPPEKAELAQPHSVAVGKDGTIFIADRGNDRILKIER